MFLPELKIILLGSQEHGDDSPSQPLELKLGEVDERTIETQGDFLRILMPWLGGDESEERKINRPVKGKVYGGGMLPPGWEHLGEEIKAETNARLSANVVSRFEARRHRSVTLSAESRLSGWRACRARQDVYRELDARLQR